MKLRPLHALYLARALEGAAYSAAMPFLLLHFMENFGLSASASGAILSLRELVPVFTAIALGWLVMRIASRAMLVAAMAIFAVSACEFLTGWCGTSGLYAAALVSGLGFGAMRIGFANSVSEVMEAEESVQGFALLHSAVNLGFVVGPLLSGWWVSHRNYSAPLYVSIGLYLAAALAIYIWFPKKSSQAASGSEAAGMFQVLKSLGRWDHGFLAALFIFTLLNGIRGQMHLLGLAKYFVDYFDSTRAATFYWIFQSLLVALLTPMGGRYLRRKSLRFLFGVYVGGNTLATLGNTLLGFFPAAQLVSCFAVFVVMTTAGEVTAAPCFGALLVRLAGKRQAGLLFGIAHTLLALGFSIGAAFGGMMMDRAIRIHYLPLYWLSLGALYFPLAVSGLALGWYALNQRDRSNVRVAADSVA